MGTPSPITSAAALNADPVYTDIWVLAAQPADLALVAEGRRLADLLGCYVHAVMPDSGRADDAIAAGADRVHLAAQPGEFLLRQCPEFGLFPVEKSQAAARAAQRHRAGLISDARSLAVDESTRALLGSFPAYGGEYFVDVAVTSAAKFATLDPRRLPEPMLDPSRTGERVPNDFAAPGKPVRDLGPVEYVPQAWRPLSKARIVVSVGRGLQDEDGVSLARKLAALLGAEVGGDRSAQDLGWVGEEAVVGLTGQDIGPDLYLAFGIRGDTVHNAAISRAGAIAAVHASPDAPLLALADWAVAAEPKAFLRELVQRLG